jgi:hypothetical protein
MEKNKVDIKHYEGLLRHFASLVIDGALTSDIATNGLIDVFPEMNRETVLSDINILVEPALKRKAMEKAGCQEIVQNFARNSSKLCDVPCGDRLNSTYPPGQPMCWSHFKEYERNKRKERLLWFREELRGLSAKVGEPFTKGEQLVNSFNSILDEQKSESYKEGSENY